MPDHNPEGTEDAPRLSKAARALDTMFTPTLTQAQVAKVAKVSQQAVSGWKAGRCKPGRDAMAAMEREFGIPMIWWTEYEERT